MSSLVLTRLSYISFVQRVWARSIDKRWLPCRRVLCCSLKLLDLPRATVVYHNQSPVMGSSVATCSNATSLTTSVSSLVVTSLFTKPSNSSVAKLFYWSSTAVASSKSNFSSTFLMFIHNSASLQPSNTQIKKTGCLCVDDNTPCTSACLCLQ